MQMEVAPNPLVQARQIIQSVKSISPRVEGDSLVLYNDAVITMFLKRSPDVEILEYLFLKEGCIQPQVHNRCTEVVICYHGIVTLVVAGQAKVVLIAGATTSVTRGQSFSIEGEVGARFIVVHIPRSDDPLPLIEVTDSGGITE